MFNYKWPNDRVKLCHNLEHILKAYNRVRDLGLAKFVCVCVCVCMCVWLHWGGGVKCG